MAMAVLADVAEVAQADVAEVMVVAEMARAEAERGRVRHSNRGSRIPSGRGRCTMQLHVLLHTSSGRTCFHSLMAARCRPRREVVQCATKTGMQPAPA